MSAKKDKEKNFFTETWQPIIGLPKSPEVVSFSGELTDIDLASMNKPLRWRKPRNILVNPRYEIFQENIRLAFFARIMFVTYFAQRHKYFFLTENPKIASEFFQNIRVSENEFITVVDRRLPSTPGDMRYSINWEPGKGKYGTKKPLHNIWIGVRINSQKHLSDRTKSLYKGLYSSRWLYIEPLKERLDVSAFIGKGQVEAVVISKAAQKSSPPDWISSIENQCMKADIDLFFE